MPSAAAKVEAYLAMRILGAEPESRARRRGLGRQHPVQSHKCLWPAPGFPSTLRVLLGPAGPYLLEYAPSFAEGLLYDYRNYSIDERLPLEFLEIYEEAARAPHGTALGYRWAGNNTIRPILKQSGQADRDCEIRENPQLAVMQQGILDFAGRYLEVVRSTGYGSQQIKPFVLATAARFVCLPRKNEIRGIIRNFSHAADFGAGNSFELGAPQFKALHLSDWRKLKRTFWRQGSLSQASRALAWLATICRMSMFGSW